MQTVNLNGAKARLCELLDRAAAGRDVIVCRNGMPLARITRLDEPKGKVRFGGLEGKLRIVKDFDGILPAAVLARFVGR